METHLTPIQLKIRKVDIPWIFPLAHPTSLTLSHIHGVLAGVHYVTSKLPHTYVTALKLLPGIADDDTSLGVATVTHAGGQRSSIAGLQSQKGDLGVGDQTGDGAVLTCPDQDAIHHGVLEGILGV